MKYIYNQDEISARIFNFVYGCAMHDAILQRAFIGKKDWVAKVEKAKSHLRKYVDCVLNNVFNSQDEHDSFFITTANEICKAINNDKPSLMCCRIGFTESGGIAIKEWLTMRR